MYQYSGAPQSIAREGAWDLTRANFIQKVYSLLTLSVLASAVGAYVGAGFMMDLYLPATIAGFLALLAAYMFRNAFPLNLILLFGFTFLEGLAAGPILGALGAAGMMPVVGKALMLTTVTFGSLTIYVFWAKTDFSFLRGYLFAALVGMLVWGLFGTLFGMGHGSGLIFSYIGVLLFMGYVLYDTSMIINRYPPNEYVAATISLYLDVLNLFWFILRILLSQSRDD